MSTMLKSVVLIFLGLKVISCCDCKLEEMLNITSTKNSSQAMGKRKLEDSNTDDDLSHLETTEEPTTGSEASNVQYDENGKTESPNVNENETEIRCSLFKNMPDFELSKMSDVWKIVYYKATSKLACFKIFMKQVTVEKRKELHKKFGNFKGFVNWMNCLFEVVSAQSIPSEERASSEQLMFGEMRHFLQINNNNKIIFENIIVSRDRKGDPPGLIEQNPDQWLLVKDLLLMRDCENGEVVVFTRDPKEASLREIRDALSVFGEAMNGTLACHDELKYKYETLS